MHDPLLNLRRLSGGPPSRSDNFRFLDDSALMEGEGVGVIIVAASGVSTATPWLDGMFLTQFDMKKNVLFVESYTRSIRK